PYLQVGGSGMVIIDDGNGYAAWSSDGIPQAAGPTITQIVSSAPMALPGQTVTLTATVTAGGAPASDGEVEFFDFTTNTYFGRTEVSNGSAELPVTLNTMTAGDTFYATYLPTSGALHPSSGSMTQVVSADTTTTVTGPAPTSTYGQSMTFTATV